MIIRTLYVSFRLLSLQFLFKYNINTFSSVKFHDIFDLKKKKKNLRGNRKLFSEKNYFVFFYFVEQPYFVK